MDNLYLVDLNDNKIEITDDINSIVKEKCDLLRREFKIPDEIYDLFLKNKSLETEIVINDFYAINISKIFELHKNYPNFIDLFWTYIGMGHMVIISMCTHTQKFFLRRDGGSNGFEREDNYLKYKNYKLDNNVETYTINQVIEMLIKNQLDQIPNWN